MVAAFYHQKILVPKVLNYIDKDVSVKHEYFSTLAERDFETKEPFKKFAAKLNVDAGRVQLIYASCQSAADGLQAAPARRVYAHPHLHGIYEALSLLPRGEG